MGKVAPTDPDHERKPTETQVVEETLSSKRGIKPTSPAKLIAPATALPSAQLMEEKADISLDDLVGHISLMFPKFETHMGM